MIYLLDVKKCNSNSAKKNKSKKAIFYFKDVFYPLSSLLNLVSLALLNNSKIFYNNKNKITYNICIKKILTQAKK